MQNFTFYNPTKLIFGKEAITQVGTEIPADKRVMICFGGGSVKANGIYDQVIKALSQHFYVEFWGIEPNPDFDTLMRAVLLARENKIDYLLAVGGGSVIDGTKFIAHAIPYTGDEWDVVANPSQLTTALPFATVVTLPATGSEMNNRAVVSRRSTQEKISFIAPFSFPQFSVLDPQVTYSLPKKQLVNGIIDSFMHVMEQYMTYPDNDLLMDRWAEGLLATIVELAPRVLEEPTHYEYMSNYMLCATMALNGFLGMGNPQDWATHRIGYELTILYGLDHGQTLAVVYPALLRVLIEDKKEKLIQYAQRVWGITTGTPDEIANKAIEATERFFRSTGMKTKMIEYGIPQDSIDIIYNRLKARNIKFGEKGQVDAETARKIYTYAYQ